VTVDEMENQIANAEKFLEMAGRLIGPVAPDPV